MSEVLKKHDPARIRAFTVWEKVMSADREPPSAETLARVPAGAAQFWDPRRAVSKEAYGEAGDDSIAWDCVYLYPPFVKWEGEAAPPHNFTARPVVDTKDQLDRALSALLRQ